MTRDTSLGLDFAGVNYYDGQGFMVRKVARRQLGARAVGASVCVQTGTTTELNLADYFRANNMEYNPVVFEKPDEVDAAYDAGRCDVYTTDASGLYAIAPELTNPDEHMVLPEIISKEPLGPVVRQGDDQWFNIVKWVHFALINAEELGVTQANVDEMKNSDNPEHPASARHRGHLRRGDRPGNDWAANVIKRRRQLRRDLRPQCRPGHAARIARGLNALWTKGGLQYAPPVR